MCNKLVISRCTVALLELNREGRGRHQNVSELHQRVDVRVSSERSPQIFRTRGLDNHGDRDNFDSATQPLGRCSPSPATNEGHLDLHDMCSRCTLVRIGIRNLVGTGSTKPFRSLILHDVANCKGRLSLRAICQNSPVKQNLGSQVRECYTALYFPDRRR